MAGSVHFSVQARRARLGARHLLAADRRADDIAPIARALTALHSTDPATVYLSAMLRMCRPSLEAVSDGLYEQRSVVRHHAMRRTVWVMEPAMARAAHAACTAAQAAKEWRSMAAMLEASSVTDDGAAWLEWARPLASSTVHRLGTATARQLGQAAPELTVKLLLSQGKSYAGTQGAHTRLIQNLGFDGTLVRTRPSGSWISGEYTWAVAADWVPGGLIDPSLDARTAAAIVARSYLQGFGPATTADLQWWAGWTAAATRTALADIAAQPVTVDDGDGTLVEAWINEGDTEVPDVRPWVAVMPSLDPTVMGWKQRRWYIGAHGSFGDSLFDRNGNAGHTLWVDGRVVGGWAQRDDGRVVIRLLDDVDRRSVSELHDATTALEGVLAGTVVRPRYPAPLQAGLLAL